MLSDSSTTDKENVDQADREGGGGEHSGTEDIPYRPLRPTHIDIKDPSSKKVFLRLILLHFFDN